MQWEGVVKNRLFSSTAFIGLACMSVAAHAQQAPQDGGGDTGDIVVTAQKRTENVQDVPKQVDVLSSEALVSAGVTRLNELSNISPSVTGSDQTQNARAPGIRGIVSIANSIGVQSQTGIIVDDIPLPTYSTLANELTDVQRVEVFAGPQSTLSGRNAAGGIINIVTRAPSFTPSADFAFEQTTDEQTRFNVFATTPVSNTVAFSVSAFLNHWAGNLRNSEKPGKFGGWKTEGVRAKLLWQPSEAFSALLTGYYLSTDRTAGPFIAGGPYFRADNPAAYLTLDQGRNPLSALPYTIKNGNRTFTSEQTATADTRDKGLSLRLDLDVGDLGTLSSITSYSKSAQPRADVFFGYPDNPATFFAYTDVQTEYKTQEIRLASPSSGNLTYLVGAIYTDTAIDQPYVRRQVFPVNWLRYVDQKSFAVFGRATWQFTDKDYLTGGLRYQHDKQDYRWDFRNVATDAVTRTSAGDSGYGFWGGEASLRHEFTPDVSIYATYSRAETGEAYDVENNAAASIGELVPLESETVNNIEAGMKARFFDRRVTFNINGFLANYKNYQVQSIDSSNPGVAPVIRLLAIGKVRTRGVETQLSFRAIDGLTLSTAGSYTDSYIVDYPGAACYQGQTAALGCMALPQGGTSQGNIAGHRLPNSPRWKGTASVDYRTPIGGGVDITGNIFYRYQSSVIYDLLGNPNTRQRGYGVLNLRAGLASSDSGWSLDFFVNNVTNKHFLVGIGDASNRFTAPAGTAAPTILVARYDRASFRYGGVRATLSF